MTNPNEVARGAFADKAFTVMHKDPRTAEFSSFNWFIAGMTCEEQFAQLRTSATSDAADAARWEHVGTVARTVMRIDVGWLKDLPAGTYLYAAIAEGGSQNG